MVAFLFTDVEGSTRLWEQHPADTAQAIALHDGILGDVIRSHDGHVFSTGGDAFCAAFSSVIAALQAGVAAQLGLLGLEVGGEPLRVRMGVHVGQTEERGGNYFGPVLNRCARLMAAGHGGQLLLSGAAAELAGNHLPDRVTLVDLGDHRLKDLAASERIFEVCHTDLPATHLPLRTVDQVLNNLPSQITAFFGREREVADVEKLLADYRLVTITGVGGGGKTRLAIQVAAEVLDLYADGVWFVDLAPISDPGLVPDVVAASLGFRPPPGQPAIDSIATYLRDRSTLLLLDNCEHLVDGVASITSRLVAATKNTTVLATSRERLGITGERVFAIPTLPLPEPSTSPAIVEANPAVQLFVDRATTLNHQFRFTPDNANAIADICLRLDCLPLAIELAAARTLSLSPKQIASHLDHRFRILSVENRSALPHQQTLRSTIDWSYQLLSPLEQTMFSRLSIFRGTFSLEAAQQICDDTSLSPLDVVDLLAALAEKSLVIVDHTPTVTRYRLLETIREYASEQLAAAGETEQLQQRHATYFVSMAEESEPLLRTAKQHETDELFEIENANFRQTLRWAIDANQTETAHRLAGALWRFWIDKSHTIEGHDWMAAVLALDGSVPDTVRVKVLHGAGTMAYERSLSAEANFYLQQTVDIYRRLAKDGGGHLLELGRALHNLGVSWHLDLGDLDRAEPAYHEALGLMRQSGDRYGVATTVGGLGSLALHKGDVERARRFFDEYLTIAAELGPLRLGAAYETSSALHMETGEIVSAIEHLERSVDQYDLAGRQTDACFARARLGFAHLEAGNVDLAIELFVPNATVVLAEPEYKDLTNIVIDLAVMRAGLDISVDKPERAAILIGAVDRLVEEGSFLASSSKAHGRYKEITEGLIDPETLQKTLARGATMTPEQVRYLITEAISQTAATST